MRMPARKKPLSGAWTELRHSDGKRGWGRAIGLKFNKTAIRAAAHKFPRRSYNLLLNYSFSRDRGRDLSRPPSFRLDWYARLDAKIDDFSGPRYPRPLSFVFTLLSTWISRSTTARKSTGRWTTDTDRCQPPFNPEPFGTMSVRHFVRCSWPLSLVSGASVRWNATVSTPPPRSVREECQKKWRFRRVSDTTEREREREGGRDVG